MSVENKTMGELVADMKDGKPVTWAQVNSAWTAEREALLKRARDNYAAGFAKGKEAALAEPRRNCELPEPRRRFTEFCEGYPECVGCPYDGKDDEFFSCEALWLLDEAKEEGGK